MAQSLRLFEALSLCKSMAMYFEDYSATSDSSLRPARYHNPSDKTPRIVERTEELPEQAESSELKKQYKEVGGNVYVKSGSIMQSSEFTLLGGTLNSNATEVLSFKVYNGVPGIYRITEDGVHTKLI